MKKGDVLAEIETPDLDAQLAAAHAKLNSARAVVKVPEDIMSVQPLRKEGVIKRSLNSLKPVRHPWMRPS